MLAWEHNNDNDDRQKLSCIEQIRFFHHGYVCRQCLLKVGIVVNKSTRSEEMRKYDSWFQLAFRLEEVWELHHKIFNMWERKEVKGKRTKKAKVDPHVEIKSKTRKSDLIIEELPKDMKLLPSWLQQGIKDERLLIFVLSRVAAKEFSLEQDGY